MNWKRVLQWKIAIVGICLILFSVILIALTTFLFKSDLIPLWAAVFESLLQIAGYIFIGYSVIVRFAGRKSKNYR